ncbi:Highly reducing polyketide synthase gloL [Bienertia sinuspersici]
MEKSLNSNNDKEFMRMAMLKHEETFRQQKVLMESAGLNQQQQQQQKQKQERYNLVESSKKAFTIDHYQQQLLLQQAQLQKNISNTNINDKTKIINHNNNIVGLNLMRSSDAQEHIAESKGNDKMLRLDENKNDEIELTLSLGPSSFNPRRQKTGKSESGQSISSSSTGSSQTKKKSPKNNDKNNRSSLTTWGGFPQGSGIEPGYSNAQQNSKNPPWLYQALSLKLT